MSEIKRKWKEDGSERACVTPSEQMGNAERERTCESVGREKQIKLKMAHYI